MQTRVWRFGALAGLMSYLGREDRQDGIGGVVDVEE